MADPLAGLDTGHEVAALTRRWHALAIKDAWAEAAADLDVDLAFDLELEEVQELLDADLPVLVRNVAETTRDEIRVLERHAAAEGWSVQQLARAIQERGAVASAERAVTVARTELARAHSAGTRLAYQKSGVVRGMRWITTDPCPICADLDGQIAPLDGEFADGVPYPPAHPHCRCAVLPVLDSEED